MFIIFLLLVGGILTPFYNVADKNVSISEEEIVKSIELAQKELNLVFSTTENFTFDQFWSHSISGYSEPKIEKSTMTFEKHNESDVYVLLKLQHHESYETLSRVLIQIFDKENAAMITEMDNVLNWKDN